MDKLVLYGILAVLLVTAAGLATNLSSTGFSVVQYGTRTCTDTDDGLNYDVKGTTSYKTYYASSSRADYCKGNYVVEYSCTTYASLQTRTHYCPNGCVDGACKGTNPPPVITPPLPCSGAAQLQFSPTVVPIGASTAPEVKGLTSCAGWIAQIKQGSCFGEAKGTCTLGADGSCRSSGFNASYQATATRYSACVDKNRDGDFSDSGEAGTAYLSTVYGDPIGPPPPPINPPQPCSGAIKISFSPATVKISSSVAPVISGLSCSGKTAYIKQGSCTYGTTKGTCAISGTGCVSSQFLASAYATTTYYYACVDKNGDGDFSDSGESGRAYLSTIYGDPIPPPPVPQSGYPPVYSYQTQTPYPSGYQSSYPPSGYESGYQSGYPTSYESGYPSSYQSGYPSSYESGYAPSSYESGYAPSSYESGYPSSYESGYPSSYQAGYWPSGYWPSGYQFS